MNRNKAREIKPIFDAFCEGKTIEYQASNGRWEETSILEIEGFPVERYRIKPEAVGVVPYRRFTYRSPSGDLIVGNAYFGMNPEVDPSFVAWIDMEDQIHEIPVEKVKAQEAKANQGKHQPADPNTPAKGGKK